MSERKELKRVLADFPIKKPFPLKRTPVELKPPAPVVPSTLVPSGDQVDEQTKVSMQTPVVANTPVQADAGVSDSTQVPTQAQVATPTLVSLAVQVNTGTQAAAPTSVAQPTPVPQQTLVVAYAQVDGGTGVTQPTVVSTEAPVPLHTSVSPPTSVRAKTEVSQATSVVQVAQFAGETRGHSQSASQQDSSVMLEAQAASKLLHGYTRIPNSILMRIASGEFIRSEIQVLLLIARFTISFQRRHAPLSKAVLERQSGLRGPAILQAISDLVAKGLIEKIPGDQYRPNQLGLKFEDQWDFFEKPSEPKFSGTHVAPPTRVAAETKVSEETPVVVQAPTQVPVSTPAGVPVATHFKYIQTIENNNSLFLLPEKIREYFSELKPARKRESEWNAFQELLREYSAENIAECLALVHERGIGSENPRPCHSPMAFLAKAISDFLPEVEERRRRIREREEHDRMAVESRRKRIEEEKQEAIEWKKRGRAFERAFPGEDCQREALVDLLRGLPFGPNSQTGRVMAIERWWEGLKKSEREDLLGV